MNRQNLEGRVIKLFWKVLNTKPIKVGRRCVEFVINHEEISLTWFVTTEESKKGPVCEKYKEEPFDRSSGYPFPMFSTWRVDTSNQLDGYTFYINTPVCQFKVPELSRQELVNVQDIIEGWFENYIPNYLDFLLNDENK